MSGDIDSASWIKTNYLVSDDVFIKLQYNWPVKLIKYDDGVSINEIEFDLNGKATQKVPDTKKVLRTGQVYIAPGKNPGTILIRWYKDNLMRFDLYKYDSKNKRIMLDDKCFLDYLCQQVLRGSGAHK